MLFSLTFPEHFRGRPQDVYVALGKLGRTIEDALQENLEAHSLWLEICASQSKQPVFINVAGPAEELGTPPSCLQGGSGGNGAWPAGGGGGGGSGLAGSAGGHGGGGALIIFELSANEDLLDIEAFVLPGTFDWTVPSGVHSVAVMAFGGGGGGGGSEDVE